MRATYAWFNRHLVVERVLTKQCPALAVFLFVVAGTGRAAPPQQTRQLWDTEFISASQPDKTTQEAKPQKPRYKAQTETPQPLKQTDSFVGITIWRLRAAQPGDEATLSVEGKQLTPERVESETPLKEGDRVRLTIEAPREGYLYVIDREQYSDNSMSDPYLIFPARRILGGDNFVKAGRLIEIPDQSDNPPYFTLRRSKPGQIAEVIAILVSPRPLPGVKTGPEASPGRPETLRAASGRMGNRNGMAKQSDSNWKTGRASPGPRPSSKQVWEPGCWSRKSPCRRRSIASRRRPVKRFSLRSRC